MSEKNVAVVQDSKWVFKFLENGEYKYTSPMELAPLLEEVKRSKVEGTFCFCVIIPDFSTKTQISFDLEGSKFMNGEIPEVDLGVIEEKMSAKKVHKQRTRRVRRKIEENMPSNVAEDAVMSPNVQGEDSVGEDS
jgi:hypothetical protein